jgi:hypothetical protein
MPEEERLLAQLTAQPNDGWGATVEPTAALARLPLGFVDQTPWPDADYEAAMRVFPVR